MTPAIGPRRMADGREPIGHTHAAGAGAGAGAWWRWCGVGLPIRVAVRRTCEHSTATGGYVARGDTTCLARDDEAAVRAAAVHLGAPVDVADRAAVRFACGDFASLRFDGPGDPELTVRW